jgi:hypothetical protein
MIELKTKEDYAEAHWKIWNWCSENPDKQKHEWPEWQFNGGKYQWVTSECFACEWSALGRWEAIFCPECLLVWPTATCAVDADDLFSLWENEEDPTKRAELARQIRDLPIREDVK